MNPPADGLKPTLSDILLLMVCRPDRLAAIGWWCLCGKRLRARYRLEAAIAALPFAYQRRMTAHGRRDLDTISAANGTIGKGNFSGTEICIHIHLSSDSDRSAAQQAAKSALRQSIAPLRVIVTTENDASLPIESDRIEHVAAPYASRIAALHAALGIAKKVGASLLIPLASDAVLPRHALAAYAADRARADISSDEQTVLYGDQDEIGRRGAEGAAWFKPNWDSRMFLSQDYVTAACALPVESTLARLDSRDGLAPETLHELVLHLLCGASPISVRHVPRVTTSTAHGEWRKPSQQRAAAISRLVAPSAQASDGPFGTVALRWPMPAPAPVVSILVATRDRVELLRKCVDGLLHETDYPDFEVIIADNDSREAETLAYMNSVAADPRVRVVRWPHPFNYSAINNFAAGHARGQFLCLLNNDIEIIDPDWLSEMMREAVRPGVGAVGARLLYPDRSIQHAGVAIGIGDAAGHAHRGLPEGEPGYFAQALVARGATAVTGACLLVERQHFDAVDGLDEESLAVAYNDVDLCLKLRERGLSNIYTPAATLIHHESKSRGLDFAPEHRARYMRELAVFQARWDTKRAIDPWHHPLLDRNSETYRFAR
ncbi:glycosyltransferase family 2 protein [Pelagerythrobacter sp.]|uniref:glycosyltransferase family 2 protein n=1 Tax=Pelagerythrobacter sp. TaxID=2800702 RepID=UPI0035B13904